jgi:hypothetical protein
VGPDHKEVHVSDRCHSSRFARYLWHVSLIS